jgi:hypothetical protein
MSMRIGVYWAEFWGTAWPTFLLFHPAIVSYVATENAAKHKGRTQSDASIFNYSTKGTSFSLLKRLSTRD